MKKIAIFLVFLAIALFAGVYAGVYLKSDKSHSNQTQNSPQLFNSDKDFAWGVHAGVYYFNNKPNEGYNPANVEKQIKLLKQLGVNFVRVNLETTKTENPYSQTITQPANDNYLSKLSENNFNILLVIDPDIPSTIGKVDYEKEGHRIAKEAATRYKGKIKYYQIANEISGTIIKPPDYNGPTFPGENGIEYSQERYEATLGWIKGMSRGIREADPSAKIVLSGHWILYDIFGQLITDGADFDIIGWSWYSPDGDDVTSREYNNGDHFNLAEKLSQFHKKLWIVESNSDHGNYFDGSLSIREGESRQADWLKTFLTNLRKTNYFSGYFFFNLADDPVIEAHSPRDGHWGLVEVDGNNIGTKPVFDAYRDFIKEHPN